eukprot:CAMPEP_0194777240 /NCGR_PEP_ID=MMETSP0323_2-20130528/65186_1 /TAXON_ID=2866 ORGANISM="Crypthecodinium cohnii, Strain Seligo" /NCGR_SAMPLE_ID=MMETSP0323_2 /ASSEMBLY_ACC=CAM_ASM_000346 /LENGTH=179 /DNA_ID=CAMNT_0039713973 /DNA_START=367 /DNA_END=906 /DNA_ORIENTATION=+
MLQGYTSWHDGIVEEATSAAHGDLAGSSVAADSLGRLAVGAAPRILIIVAEQADVACLPPLGTPGVLDQPVLVARFVLAVGFCQHGMAQNGVLRAIVKDARVVVEPIVAIDGNDDWALFHQSLHQGLCAIAWQLVPAADPDARGMGLPKPIRLRAGARARCVGQILVKGNTMIPDPGIG